MILNIFFVSILLLRPFEKYHVVSKGLESLFQRDWNDFRVLRLQVKIYDVKSALNFSWKLKQVSFASDEVLKNIHNENLLANYFKLVISSTRSSPNQIPS